MFRRQVVLLVLIASLIAIVWYSALAGSAIVTGAVDCPLSCELRNAKIDGEIDASTVNKVGQLIDQTHAQALREKKPVNFAWGVELDSPGGSVSAAMAIGRLFRKQRVSIRVPHWAVCHSSCVLIVAGAARRFKSGGNRFSVPDSEVRKPSRHPLMRTSESKGH